MAFPIGTGPHVPSLDDLAVNTPAPDFADFTAGELGSWATDYDGWEAIFEGMLAALPGDGVVGQSLDDLIALVLPWYVAIGGDYETDFPVALESFAEQLLTDWDVFAGLGYGLGPLSDGPPSLRSGKLQASSLPKKSNISAQDLVSYVTNQVIADLPTTPGGTPTQGGSTTPIRVAPAVVTGPTPTPLLQATSGPAGLISVDSQSNVTWNSSPTAQQPVVITVQATGQDPQTFASGPSGKQPAPWLLQDIGPVTFTLTARGIFLDQVTVNSVRLAP